jgi:hypothetical protein
LHRVLSILVIALWVGALALGTAAAAEMKHQGEHAMSGTVTDIDPQTGKLSLSTEVGDLELHFPPSALKGVKEGDSLTVYLSFSKGDATSTSPKKQRR